MFITNSINRMVSYIFIDVSLQEIYKLQGLISMGITFTYASWGFIYGG